MALTALVVAHHCAVTYGNIPVWFYNEPPQDPSGTALDVFVLLNQSYFMGLFFLISGYFVPGSVDRKGAWAFARDRLRRLGIPVLLYVAVVRPLAGLPSWLSAPDVPYPVHYLVTIDAGPTWFLEVLLVFSLAYAAYRARRRSAPGEETTGVVRPARAGAALLGLVVLMAVAGAAWRQVVPDGTHWPVVGLPTPAFLPQYGLMFAAGVLAGRTRWLERMPGSVAVLGGSLCPLAVPLLATSSSATHAGVAAGVATAVLGVGLSAVVLVTLRRVARGTGVLREKLSANAFAVYVIHPAVLVGLAVLLRGWSGPAIAKFSVLVGLALPVCWLLAAALRRIPAVRAVL